MTNRAKNHNFGKTSLIFCWFDRERERGGEKKKSNLLSTIHEVLSVGIGRAKNQSSSSRRGLHMSMKNEGFHRRSKERDFEKSKFSGLGDVLETSFSSTTLKEVGILPTLVYFSP